MPKDPNKEEATVYLGLGSNLGYRQENLAKAIQFLKDVVVDRCSSLYETEPWGYKEQPHFLNAVCRGRTRLTPLALLHIAKRVEATLGRKASFSNAPRPIDIDILLYNDQVITTPRLTIPHPAMAERAFVLVPLSEIAPDLIHPTLNKTIGQLAEEVEGKSGVRWYQGPDWWHLPSLKAAQAIGGK
ncbi:MAG: 2-amino-4-hydroxy-6-hydroxymethyldihydropteridine diphosphokinase [Chloroflexi bacterium]|nr:2-amino-4-hydroxy-6-hydroxymethyldihydropteridine diphosphokinase [Chloroflexota bacterium]